MTKILKCYLINKPGFHIFKNLILGHRRASSYGSSVAAMQNMPPQTPGHHPYQMIRGHSHEQLYGHPHPGQPMYSPYYYRKWFYVYYLYPDLNSQTIC